MFVRSTYLLLARWYVLETAEPLSFVKWHFGKRRAGCADAAFVFTLCLVRFVAAKGLLSEAEWACKKLIDLGLLIRCRELLLFDDTIRRNTLVHSDFYSLLDFVSVIHVVVSVGLGGRGSKPPF